MAIQKSKSLPNGAQGNYWRILDINISRQNFSAEGTIALFKDKATSDAGMPHLGFVKTFKFKLSPSDFATSMNVIAFVYGKIKAQAETIVSIDSLGRSVEPAVSDSDLAGGVMA